MSLISDDQLHALLKHSAPRSVSLWMPAHRAGPDIRQDPIRMKNLLSRAEEQLVALGLRAPEADERLSPLRAMAEDSDFWRHQAAGLGVLLGEGDPHVLHLPTAADELAVVGERFHLKPVLAALRHDERFYLLELSKNTVRLFRGDRTELEAVDLPRAPRSFGEFVRFDDPERHVEFHTGAASHKPGAARPAVFHGQGGAADEAHEKRRLTGYCRQINAALVKALGDERAPLLLAAAEPLQGIFRGASSCPQLDERVVQGNPDESSKESLRQQAVALLAADFERPVREAAARYHQARHAGLALSDLEGIVRAAYVSAVEVLLVALGEQCWGRFDPDGGTIERHDAQQAGDEDLLNVAAVLAARGGATVLAVDAGKVPHGSPAAATLRFRLEG
jgi:hypothetical protein